MEPGFCTTLIATASSDSTVRIWQREEGGFQYQQSIPFGSGFALDVSLAVLPGTAVPVLACGADDHKIHLFVLQHGQFQRSQSLPGHEDWVQGVEFSHNGRYGCEEFRLQLEKSEVV
ncbi:elongator complex protein 2 [Lingula anatina]|uniref:Elongator complex protein 2 n=1 Tax=Lingula anatina TaxID=7574 RepID=A0A1S3HY48_LINAN|nr:elongator complex protein 2 [Lingula anatina]|eukprot:XP_013389999.1 elongator complex protein 2 [Lingula anatina]